MKEPLTLSNYIRLHAVKDVKNLHGRLSTMIRHDFNHNISSDELVLYCDVKTEKAVYRIQSGLSIGGFYRNRKKARKVLETRNKAHKENGTVYERSVSVPAMGAQTGTHPVTSPEDRSPQNKLRVVLPQPNSNFKHSGRHPSEGDRSLTHYGPNHHSMDYDTHPLTPGTPKEYLTSPPIDSAVSYDVRGGNSSETGGLFRLRKDHERRTKLIDILTEDAEKLIELCMKDEQEATQNQGGLEESGWKSLIQAIRDYILTQEKEPLEQVLHTLYADVVQLGRMNIDDLKRCIYSFYETSTKILRLRSMPPHWIFAFDDFLKCTVSTSIEYLDKIMMPEEPQHESGEPTPSLQQSISVSTSVGLMDFESINVNKYRKEMQKLQEEYLRNQEENYNVMRELCTMDKNYSQLLKSMLRDKRAKVQYLSDALAMPAPPIPLAIGSTYGIDSPDSPGKNLSEPPLHSNHGQADEKLVSWLHSLRCDNETILKFIAEEYTMNDILELVNRDDLRRMNLRGGVECRIWREILKARQTSGLTPSVFTNSIDSD